MPLRKFVSQVALKLGSGAQSPAGTDVIMVFDASYEHGVEITERNEITGNLMKFTGIPGKRMGTIKFSCYLKGSGTAGTAPEFGDALKACRLNETIVASTSVTYKPLVSETSVASVQVNRDGTLFKVQDAVGDVEFIGEVGKPMQANFTFIGTQVAPADTGTLSPTFDTTIPPALMNSTVTLNGVTTHVVRTLNYRLGNSNTMRDDIAAATGYAGAFNGDRRTTGSAQIEMPTVAADNIWSKLQTPTTGVFQHAAIGSAGNLVQLKANVGSYTSLAESDQDGRMLLDCEFLCGRAAATTEGDDFNIIFT